MKISARSYLMTGVAALSASAIAISPVQVPPGPPPAAAPAPTVELAAQTRTPDFATLVAAVQQRSPNAVAAMPLVADDPAPTAALIAFPGLGNAIIGVYNLVIPVVDYGVDLAQYIVGFIPFGFLIGDQIGIFYDTLIRPIVTSITFNVANWIGGGINFGQGLVNVVNDSITAGINFGTAEINWGLSLIGLPPLPFAAVQQASTVELAADESTLTEPGEAAAPRRPIRAITTAVGELTKIFTPEKTLEEAVEDSTTDAREIDPGNTTVTRSLAANPRAIAKGVVQAQGEVRGAIADATKAVADAAKPGERGSADDAIATVPQAFEKSARDVGRAIAGSAKKAADDARNAARSTANPTGESEDE